MGPPLHLPDRFFHYPVFFLLLLGPWLLPSLSAQELLDTEARKKMLTDEAGAELVSLNVGDSEVSLLAAGSWKGTFGVNWGLALTPLGMSAVSNDSPLLFTQEVDLTLSLWIHRHWFVEAGFLDDYALNTYRAGYQGFPGEALQYLGVGNTGLDFPVFPYLDLGGDSPSSFGVYGKFGGGELSVHSLVRYDAAVREERVFVGGRERTYSYGSLNSPLRGRSFVLPDEDLSSVPVIYLEDPEGALRDSRGGRWRTARPGEFAVSARYGLVELAASPGGRAAAAYSKGGSNTPWNSSLGNYGPPGSGFLAGVQGQFPEADLKSYPQCGGGNGKPGEVLINGIPALVIYEGGTFSPFESQNRYQAPSSSAISAALVRRSTGETLSGYQVIPLEDVLNPVALPLYNSAGTERGIYELIPDAAGTPSANPRDPGRCWPLAQNYPGLYLPGGQSGSGDLGLRFTSYGQNDNFFLGTDVVPGSVQVYRGGLADPAFTFSPQSGAVRLGTPSGTGEIIHISYLKRSGERRLGSLAAGLGAIYDPEGPFSAELALGIRWNLSGESFSEAGSSSPGMVALGSQAAWDYGRFRARLNLGLGFEQPDTTGLYRAAGMEGNELSLALSPERSFISEIPAGTLVTGKPAPLVYRNYRDTSILGTSTLMQLSWNAPVVGNRSGPYPAMDNALAGQVLVGEFELGGAETWTGFQVPLGADGALLEGVREIEIPFRFYNLNLDPSGKLEVFVQFGALSDKDASAPENLELMVERQLFSPVSPGLALNPNTYSEEARIVSITFSSADRQKLQNAKYMRIIVRGNGNAVSGRILVAPPILRGSFWRPVTFSGGRVEESRNGEVEALEIMDAGTGSLRSQYPETIDRLHSAGSRSQRVLKISWGDGDSLPITGAGADGRIGQVPLGAYRELSFFFRTPATDNPAEQSKLDSMDLRFILARGPESLETGRGSALDLSLPLSVLSPGTWSKITLRYGGGERRVLVDGKTEPTARLSYNPEVYRKNTWEADPQGEQSAYALFLIEGNSNILAGNCAVDEIILEDPLPVYLVNAGGSVEWTHPGTLVSLGGKTVLSDLSASTALETGARGNPFESSPEDFSASGFSGMASRSRGEALLLGTRLSGNLAFSISNTGSRWEAGHGISRSFGPLRLWESFSVLPDGENLDHRAGLDLTAPFKARFSAQGSYEEQRLRQRWNGAMGTGPFNVFPLSLSLEAAADWTESSSHVSPWLGNYGEAWLKSWPLLVPNDGDAASKRESRAGFKSSLQTVPLGADLSLEGSAAFSKPRNSTQSGTQGRLEFPLMLGEHRLRFTLERGFSQSLWYFAENVREDVYKWAEGLRDSEKLWYTIPFYSFFDPWLGDTLDTVVEKSPAADYTQYSRFEDKFLFSLRNPARYDLGDFFLPNSFDARVGRSVERRLDTMTDILNLAGSLGFSAVNMFGAFGSAPLFRFYSGDEFIHSLEASWAIPRESGISWKITGMETMRFFGFAGAELSLSNTLTINSRTTNQGRENWLESLGVGWTAPSPRSLLGALYDRVCGGLSAQPWLVLAGIAGNPHEKLRKETLELVIDHTREYPRVSLAAGHESIIRIPGRIDLSAFAKINCAHDSYTEVLSFIPTLGLSLQMRF